MHDADCDVVGTKNKKEMRKCFVGLIITAKIRNESSFVLAKLVSSLTSLKVACLTSSHIIIITT
jgi:hypothetical protein